MPFAICRTKGVDDLLTLGHFRPVASGKTPFSRPRPSSVGTPTFSATGRVGRQTAALCRSKRESEAESPDDFLHGEREREREKERERKRERERERKRERERS